MNAFKWIDGKLVELKGFDEWPFTMQEAVVEQPKPKLIDVTLTPRKRRFYARKGRPRRQAKRVAKHSTEWRFPEMSSVKVVVWQRHSIVMGDKYYLPRFDPTSRLVCFVYVVQGQTIDDEVLHAVEIWEARRVLRSLP